MAFHQKSLENAGYTLKLEPVVWTRAKERVKRAEADLLFIAGKFQGRDEWAEYSLPVSYEYFGPVDNVRFIQPNGYIGAMRINDLDRIISTIPPEKLITVADNLKGLTLLSQNKLDKHIMSDSFARFLINNYLPDYQQSLRFEMENAEKVSMHLVISKQHEDKELILQGVNDALNKGIESGIYQKYAQQYQLPKHSSVIENN